MAISSGTYTIGTGGDYSTIASAFADVAATLTGALTFKLKAQDFSQAEQSLTTTNTSSEPFTITYDTGAFHNGDPSTGARVVGTSGVGFSALNLIVKFVTIEGITFVREGAGTNNDYHAVRCSSGTMTGGDWAFKRNWYIGDRDGTTTYGGNPCRLQADANLDACLFENCCLWQFMSIGGSSATRDKFKVYHCTAVKQSSYSSTATMFARYCLVKNCAAFEYGQASSYKCYLDLHASSATYAASDDSGSAAGLDNLAKADCLTDAVNYPGNGLDFTPIASSALDGAGTAGVLSTDMLGNSYDGSAPTLGAFQITGGGAAASLPPINPAARMAAMVVH